MNILVTGAKGFIGKNVIAEFSKLDNYFLFEYDLENNIDELQKFINDSDFIIHLAGVNRPKDSKEFLEGNLGFTDQVIECVKNTERNIPVLMTSSIQATKNNDYGKSKKAAEDALLAFNKETGNKIFVYRLPNVFGKWCKPNYNSAVATFCYNITHNLPIQVNNPGYLLPLVYIDDILEEISNAINNESNLKEDGFCYVPVTNQIRLQDLADMLYRFKENRNDKMVPLMSNDLEKKMYSTFISYYDPKEFSYELKMNVDHRGSFTEFLKTVDYGQVSVNISKPGITKGNHWHHTKNEKFLVVYGQASIKFRKIDEEKVYEYITAGDKLEVVDIPPGYTHNITTISETDSVTIMWANELFDKDNPDTFYLEV
ncbi:MAG: NAD-dependent epimerase/dehydratase family protein [Tenericutes bacterium]|nr:NAD-dependent epimerase/dehydratase family protein [Mycoplasmatota bacterium]